MRQIDKDVLDASINGDLEKAERAIENGADIEAQTTLGDRHHFIGQA
jgi:hypothetical protein